MNDDLTVVVDTREQWPLNFNFPTVRETLHTGDYSVEGYENEIAIERKGVDDLVSCLKNDNRERFERELDRGRSLNYFALCIESELSAISNHRYQSCMNTVSVIQSLVTFSVRYRLPIFFCPNRQYTARITESLLQKYHRESNLISEASVIAKLRSQGIGQNSGDYRDYVAAKKCIFDGKIVNPDIYEKTNKWIVKYIGV